MNQTIYSENLPDNWQEEYVLEKDGEELKLVLVFTDKVPKTADLKFHLSGRKSKAEVVVACLGHGSDNTKMDIRLIHDAEDTFGRITARVALFDDAGFMLKCLLDITEKGKGSDSYFSAKGLLVSPRARAEIYPYLEIKTDEVKASHGATVGRIDNSHLFYLQSRGVGKKDAEKFILAGYFNEFVQELPLAYKTKFFQEV